MGDRGAGKSTTLHQFAQELLKHAKGDLSSRPIPIVLSIPDWEDFCKGDSSASTFRVWLVKELVTRYETPIAFGKDWIDKHKLVLLLDGLDELKNNQEQRNKCISAINQFKKENRFTEIIICSEIQVYEELESWLDFDLAFEIQPLEAEQIETFLNQSDEEFSKIKAAYQEMPQQFFTPLDLNVIALACQEPSIEELHNIIQGKEWYPRFWKQYIEKMFRQRKDDSRYPQKRVQKWLQWLAQKLPTDSHSILIEQLQPT